ncbi:MAG: UbiX family flavin prenyltransferase [Xanthomonadales bacterium]|nr:UbiX family flavin prenyltransferase [Xanthomonadales bacterium]
MKLVIGISGASGAIYGVRMLQVLQDIDTVETHLILSRHGRLNIEIETDFSPREVEAMADQVHSDRNLAASLSSGSFQIDAMVVAPCSMKTLSGIVNSYSDNLLVRAADVTLKEFRKLVIVPRESPLHVGHTRLLHEAAKMGALIVPPMPAFYNRPKTVDDIINHTVGRVLDLLGIEADLVRRWQGLRQP